MTHLDQYLSILKTSLANNTFIKLSLGNYKGTEKNLKNIYVKRIQLKDGEKLSFTYRYQTNDIVKNFFIDDAITLITDLIALDKFRQSSVFTLECDVFFEFNYKNQTTFKKNDPSHNQLPSLDHNVQKQRLITANSKTYLQLLKITDEKGAVINSSQDKFKQINHYVELLSPLIKNLPKHETLQVLDMGAGKGYLTFALYDYLTQVLKLNAQVVGVEYRKDLVELCNGFANQSQFSGLTFSQGTIKDFDVKQTNVLIALHACDTATDEAIYKGITTEADLIVVAPCCHKQIRKEIEHYKVKNELDFLLKHGIFLERQAEMVTDGIRSLILEYFGYTTKVFEFISGEHTPKNVMIVAEKKSKTDSQRQELLQKIKDTKAYFGILTHHLETLMDLN